MKMRIRYAGTVVFVPPFNLTAQAATRVESRRAASCVIVMKGIASWLCYTATGITGVLEPE